MGLLGRGEVGFWKVRNFEPKKDMFGTTRSSCETFEDG